MPQNINLIQNLNNNDLRPQKEINSFKSQADKAQEFLRHLKETQYKETHRREEIDKIEPRDSDYKTKENNTDNEKLKIAREVADYLEGKTEDENIINIIESMIKLHDAANKVMPFFNFNNLDQATFENDKLLVPVDLSGEKIKLINEFIKKADIKLSGKIELFSSNEFKQIDLTKLSGDSVKNTDQNLLNSINNQKGSNNNTIFDQKLNNSAKTILLQNKAAAESNSTAANNNININTDTLKSESGLKVKIEENRNLLNSSTDMNSSNDQNLISTPSIDADSSVTKIVSSNNSALKMELSTKHGQIEAENLFDRTVMNQLVKKVSFGLSKDSDEIKINLKPPSLGKVEIKISIEGNNVKAIMVTENSLVKDIVEANLAQLKNSLLEQGLKVEQFSVLVGDNSQFSGDSKRSFDELFDENGERKISSGNNARRYNKASQNVIGNVANARMSNSINDRLDIFV